MLNNLGFNYTWINQNVHNTSRFFKLCTQRLKDQCVSNKLIRKNIICSKYMNVIKVQKHKFAYFKFLTKKCGKWYHRKVYNERMLTACNVLGDEYHFVIECQINTDIRSTYLSRYYWRKPSMSKFIELIIAYTDFK